MDNILDTIKGEFEQHDLFKTPVWISNCTDLDNSDIISEAYRMKEQCTSVTKYNRGGYQSTGFLPVYCYKAIYERMYPLLLTLPYRPRPFRIEMIDAWFNIDGYKDNHILHHNLDEYDQQKKLDVIDISGIYCAKIPENSESIINIKDPRGCGPIANQYYKRLSYESYEKIILDEGDLIVFPPFVEYSIDSNMSEEDRIFLSFNIKFGNSGLLTDNK